MQFAWLEKLSSDGTVRPEVKAQIYRDCSDLLKLASVIPEDLLRSGTLTEMDVTKAHLKELGKSLKPMLGNIAGMLALSGIGLGGKALLDRSRFNAVLGNIQKTRTKILNSPEISAHKEKADARFLELAKLAPTIAADEKKALELVKKRLHDGFTDQDRNHLTLLQATYTSKDPGYAGRVESRLDKTASARRLGELYADVMTLTKEASRLGGLASGIRGAGQGAANAITGMSGGITPGTMMHALKNVALVSSIPLLAGVGAGAVKEYAASRDAKDLSRKLQNSFETALRMADPENDALHRDKAKAYQAFQTLAHFAPHVAIEPSAARGFMNKLVSYDSLGIGTGDVKDLAEIERNLSQTSSGDSPFFSGFQGASELLGLGDAVRQTMKDTTDPLREKNRAAVARDLGVDLPGKRKESKG